MDLFTDHLRSFCAANRDVREYLRSPMRHNDAAILTNGAIVLRIRAIDEGTLEPLKQLPFADFPAKIDDAARRLAEHLAQLPALPAPIHCPFCNGSGFDKPCPVCDDVNSTDCAHCDGDGVIPAARDDADALACFFCDGTGHERQGIDIGSGYFDSRLLALIARLDGALFAPDNATDAAYFRCDIGDGLVMPMRK